MRVSELIEMLRDCEPGAEVFAVYQRQYPFEARLDGVVVRGDIQDERDDDEDGGAEDGEDEVEDEQPAKPHDRWTARKLPSNEVLILVGDQTRYGSRAAWEARR